MQMIRKECDNKDKVESVPLWSITVWDKRFKGVDAKKQKRVITYPYLLADDLFALQQEQGNVFLLSTGEKTGWTTESLAGSNLCNGEVVTIPWGKSRPVSEVMKYYKGKFVTADNRIVTSSDVSRLRNKYLYYWMLKQGKIIDGFYRGDGIKHPSMKLVLDMQVPVPPINIQDEIIRILDHYTKVNRQLLSSLKEELRIRQQQFAFYQKSLFDLKDYPCLRIGEFADCYAGATPSTKKASYWNKGVIPWMSSGEVNLGEVFKTEKSISQEGYNHSSTKLLPVNTVVIALAGQGKTRGTVAITRIPLCTNQSLCGIIPDERVNSEYLLYYLKSQYKKLRDISSGSGFRGGLNLKLIKTVEIPVPPVELQIQIAKIAASYSKAFSEICKTIIQEIDLREIQYTFYRDRLFSLLDND